MTWYNTLYFKCTKFRVQNEEVSVDLDAPIWIVSDQFLSITIDSYAIQSNWYGIDLKSPQLLSLAKALAPAMLRIGGTAQDFILFSENNTDTKQSLSPKIDYNTYYSHKLKFEDLQNFVMSASQWDAVNKFALAVGWEITFGLNVFLRKHWPENGWNTTNAKQLMEYTISKGYQVNWELGNGNSACMLVSSCILHKFITASCCFFRT